MKTRGPFHRAARAVARRALRRATTRLSPPAAELEPGAWRLERDAGGQLRLDGAALCEVAREHGSPLHVVDAVRLRENAARYTASPAAAGKGCEIFYAYLTNPVPGVLRALHAHGVGAAVSSPYELWLAQQLGVPGERIVYNCPLKPKEALERAILHRVGLINLNSRHEVGPLARLARAMNRKVRVGIRASVPHAIAAQFGERIDDGSALQTFAEALERPELTVVGLQAHLSGELVTREDAQRFLSAVLRFCTHLRARLGVDLEVLDLGGHLAVPTVTPTPAAMARVQMALGREVAARVPADVLGIDDYVALVTRGVEAHYRRAGRPTPRILLEPGRSMTSNTQLLLLTVRQVRNPDDTGVSTVVLDGGIGIADPLKSERHQVFTTTVRPGADVRAYRLSGPSCTMSDLLVAHCRLPRLEVGDVLAVMDSGAYFVPFSTTFSFPRPGVVMLDRGAASTLRRAETFEDLVALDRLEAA